MKKQFFFTFLFISIITSSCKKDNQNNSKYDTLLIEENNAPFVIEKSRGWDINRTVVMINGEVYCFPPGTNCFDDVVIRPEGEKPPPVAPNQRFSVNKRPSYTDWLEIQENTSPIKFSFKGGEYAIKSALQDQSSKYGKYRILLNLIPEENRIAIIKGEQSVCFYNEVKGGVTNNFTKLMIIADNNTNNEILSIPIVEK